ncbi:nuclear transport factor 2 family protein [Cryptosporangium sp. NPDC048952]|uniref:nuclear transport factor 2 family protein n=1 Tax=Cryptosporangium sp. NPDC048952 TaxID=3363961 RepID=UPI00371E7A0D
MDTEAMYQQYVWAGAMRRDADAVADLFTEDGVLEAPLVPEGHVFPHRLEGRDEIRCGLAEYYAKSSPSGGTVDGERSRLVLHHPDPDTLIAELDAAFTDAPPVFLVQVFRFRDGAIAHLRDYFHPDTVS